MNFKEELHKKIDLIDKYLDIYLPEKKNYQANLYRAMRYSLFAGGKRLRPVITLACCEMIGGQAVHAIPFACGMEMIHTYSLIHDDLPAMDNDDYRRGKLTNHKVFGEAMAILAGDGLLNKAFEIVTTAGRQSGVSSDKVLEAVSCMAEASGAEGMIGGQVVDLESENRQIDMECLRYMHLCKTGAIIKASAKIGAILGGANDEQKHAIEVFSNNLGLAFQIRDDILDIEGNQEKLGKPIGSDVNNGKSTFVSLMGLEKSKKIVKDLSNEAINCLKIFEGKECFLVELTRYLINREE